MGPMLIGITLISFIVIHLAPGEPTDMQTQLNPKASAEAYQRLREHYGLNDPVHVQYWNWLKRIAKLDLGNSFRQDGRPVLDKIKEALPITILLNVLSLLLILLVSIPIGVLAATRQYSLFDKLTTVVVYIGFAVPTFWLALLMMILFGLQLGWLPISGLHSFGYELFSPAQKISDLAKHLALPVFVAAFGGLAGLSRYMRLNLLEVIRQDYILTARAKGLSENTVIYKHALRNALLPVITILGLSIPGLIGGGVIFESIFSIPGMGRLFYESVMARDYPVVMGILVIGGVLTLLGNLIADASYALADPRIRHGK
jgi:peptide/nickel transport system permease protein